jgi:beta-galactosidase
MFTRLFCAVIVGFLCLSATAACAVELPAAANIAAKAKVSASSSRPEYPLPGVNDGRMETQWSTAQGATSGQWLQMDWDQPEEICGVVLLATGPWTQSVDVQVRRDGAWVSVAKSGSPEEKTPVHAVISFRPTRTKSLRLALVGGAAYHEVQVCADAAIMARLVTEQFTKASIVVAGDLRGRLMGTVSMNDGSEAVRDAEVTVSGTVPSGAWQHSAVTGRQGDFEVPLPFMASGPLRVEVKSGENRVEQAFDSRDVSTQLTPRCADSRDQPLSLDGDWQIAADPPKGFPADRSGMKWQPIKTPAHWEMEGLVAESGRAAYRKTFTAPAEWQGRRIKLRADAIYSRAQVWINGRRAGGHEGGFTPFELDVTEMLALGGQNEIVVLVDARTMAADLDNASVFAYFELAGIWQPIGLFAVPPAHVSHLALNTTFDPSYSDAELAVELDVVNARPTAATASLNYRLFDPQGKELRDALPRSEVRLSAWERKTISPRVTVKAPQPWNAERPRLFKLVIELTDAAGGKRTIEQRFGFRQIEIKDRVLLINGRPVKFRGISRLDAHPLLGRALTLAVDRQDAEMIKDANFNLVRATIAPPHPVSLDYADELGLYVENEGPTCWGNHATDLRYAAVYRGIMAEYIERDRNHPCVVDWSICNESDYQRVFSMAHQKLKTIDSSRVYSGTWGDDTLDLAVYHHPISLQRIRDSLGVGKPAFFDEVLGTFHGWEDYALFEDIDPGMRDYWITGMPEIQRALNAGKNQAGAVQFCWTDDTFLVPGKAIDCWRCEQPPIRYTESIYKLPRRGIVGDVVWGTVDGWRRPRPEYWLSKKLYSPVQTEEKPLDVPAAGSPLVIAVENFNQFIDLDQYVCRWQLAGEKGEARAKAAPLSKGTLTIALQRPPKADDRLRLEFFDERGRMVDKYCLAFRPHPLPVFPNSGRPARIAEEKQYLSFASAIRLLGPKVELAYDRTSGELYRALADREVVMSLGPKLHIQKSKAPMLKYPQGTFGKIGVAFGPEDVPGDSVWHLTGSDVRTEGNQAVLNWKGRYGKDFDGGFEIRMDDAGDAEFRYSFTYRGPEMFVREIGLEFELPLSCDCLRWDRKAEYSCYPDDHIGRPVGRAMAHPKVPQQIPPGDRPYGLDDHPWGCNDFRSTKRNIYTASLTNGEGQGVEVISDGTQHVRATVGTHDIQLKVLDYYGGTSWTYNWGYHYGPGRVIKPGDVLKGTVKLRLLMPNTH